MGAPPPGAFYFFISHHFIHQIGKGKTYTTHVAKHNTELLCKQTHMNHDGLLRVWLLDSPFQVYYLSIYISHEGLTLDVSQFCGILWLPVSYPIPFCGIIVTRFY